MALPFRLDPGRHRRRGHCRAADRPVCNSGNSTQPHLHLQVMDSADLSVAQGVPLSFRSYREWRPGAADPASVEMGIPGERCVVAPM
ncbi:MAG: peptidase [Microbacteriaceae bacterium]|jgi:hypothetical protein|nr:peptidase [Microbacteriaceae bacterium]